MTTSEERELLRETVAALVTKHADPAAVRAAMESDRGYDESLWRLLCEQVGAAALGPDPGVADSAAILVAAEQIGAAERCLELTVEYAKSRVQFGRPIGSFQALKHRMADLYVAIAAARAVVDDACGDPTPTNAAAARLAATEALQAVAAEGIQLHGGIAITWEHDMHLYFKRAHGSAHLLGSTREQLRRLESEVLQR